MSTPTKTIRIAFNPAGVISGVAQANAALQTIGTTGTGVNNRLNTSFGNVGRAINGMGTSLNAANANTRAFGQSAGAATGALNALAGGARGALTPINSLGSSLSSMKGLMTGLPAAIGGVVALLGVGTFSKAADDAALLNSKLKLAVADWGDYGQAQADVAAIARMTRTDIAANATLYGKFSQAGKTLNASQAQVARATESVSKAFKVSGATAQEAEAGLLQLGQAMSSGKLGGDEFSSLMETSPRLMKLFADSINQPVGALKGLASDGKLTADVLFKALSDPKFTAKLDAEFKQMPKTFGDSMTAVQNTAMMVFGAFDSGGGFSTALFNFADSGSANMQSIAGAARSAGEQIRDAFAGLSTAFQPLFQGGSSVFAALGIRAQSLSQQIAGILGAIDSVRNFLPNIQNAANAWDRKNLGDNIYTRGLKDSPVSNMAGDYRASAAKSRFDRARSGLVSRIQERDPSFIDAGISSEMLIAKWRSTKPKPKLTGGTGNLTPPPQTPKKDGGGADKGASEAAARAKRQNEYWDALKGELETSRLFGIELTKVTKERELQKILGHAIAATEKSRIADLVQSIANEKAITSIKQATFELENKNTLLRARALGMTEDQSRIEDALDAKRAAALNDHVDISSKDFQLALAKYRVELETSQLLEKQAATIKQAMETAKQYGGAFGASFDVKNLEDQRSGFLKAFGSGDLKDAWGKPMGEATRDGILKGIDQALIDAKNKPFQVAIDFTNDAIKSNGSVSERRGQAQKEFEQTMTTLRGAREAGVITAEGFRVASYKAGLDLKDRFAEIGTDFANKLNTVASILSEAGDIIGGKVGEVLNQTSDVSRSFSSFGDTSTGISDSITSAFGRNSPAVQGIGNAVGGAMAGLKIGESIGALGKSLGIKNFDKGAKIGGAIGGLTGNPLIAAGASAIGGLISSIITKTKSGGATITGGAAGDIALSGNSGAFRKVASGLAGSVQGGLAEIAAKLGGTVGSFGGITIGKRGDDFRVNTTGSTSLKGKRGATDFGDDEAAAIAFAIKTAVSRGAIAGLSDIANKAVSSLDIDSAISFVTNWNEVMGDFKSMTDPIGASVEAIINPLKGLADTMKLVGASTEDLTKLDQYRSMKLKDVLKDQLSSLNDFMSALKGEGSGITDLTRLNTSLDKFADYQSRIKSGDTSIDQAEFTKLGQEIFTLAGSLYGTSTSMFQDVRSMLITATEGFSTNITNAVNGAAGYDVNASTVTAINSSAASTQMQNDTMIANQAIANDLARQQLEATMALVEQIGRGNYATAAGYNGSSGYQLV